MEPELTPQEIDTVNSLFEAPGQTGGDGAAVGVQVPPASASEPVAAQADAVVVADPETPKPAAEPETDTGQATASASSEKEQSIADRVARLIDVDKSLKAKHQELSALEAKLDPLVQLQQQVISAGEAGDYLGVLSALWPDKTPQEIVLAMAGALEEPKQMSAKDIDEIVSKKVKEVLEGSTRQKEEAQARHIDEAADLFMDEVAAEYRKAQSEYPLINDADKLTRAQVVAIVRDTYRSSGRVPSPGEVLKAVNERRLASLTRSGFVLAKAQPNAQIPGAKPPVDQSATGNLTAPPRKTSHAEDMEAFIADLAKKFS